MNGWEVKYLRFADLQLVQEPLRPYFVAEFLKNIGCKSIREPSVAPGVKASSQASPRTPGWGQGGGSVSDEAREAGIVLNDPKASPRSGGKAPRR